MKVKLREKRQVTIPSDVCEQLGLREGDEFDLRVENGTGIIEPRRTRALKALSAIRAALKDAGVTEEELLESGREIRKEIFRERYPDLAAKHGI
jgi:AbrB family looped-hinge helix DNA binding protein